MDRRHPSRAISQLRPGPGRAAGSKCGFVVAAFSAAVTLPVSGQARAQTNIEKLRQLNVATADLNIVVAPQTGANANAVRENLKRVKSPPGFSISHYAVVPDARHMAVAPSTNMLVVGTRRTTVWAVTDRNSDGIADLSAWFAGLQVEVKPPR